MKQKHYKGKCEACVKPGKRLSVRSAVSAAALAAACAILLTALVFSRTSLKKLERELAPLIGQGIRQAQTGELASAAETSVQIRDRAEAARIRLMLIADHRDIAELMRLADEACLLGADCGKEEYIVCFNGIAALLKTLIENDRVTIGNLL